MVIGVVMQRHRYQGDRNPKNSFDDVVRELQEIKENDEQYSNDNTELLLQIDDTIQKTSDARCLNETSSTTLYVPDRTVW